MPVGTSASCPFSLWIFTVHHLPQTKLSNYLLFAQLFQLLLSPKILPHRVPETVFYFASFPPSFPVFQCKLNCWSQSKVISFLIVTWDHLSACKISPYLARTGSYFCCWIKCTATAATNRTFNKNRHFFPPTALTARSQKELMNRLEEFTF